MPENHQKRVFLGYRRATSAWFAREIYRDLEAHGFDVFMDTESIGPGKFAEVISAEIEARPHYVIALSPGCLVRTKDPEDWVRKEVEHALKLKRNVVPVFEESFDFRSGGKEFKGLAPSIQELPKFNGVKVPQVYAEAALSLLRTEFLTQAAAGQVTALPAQFGADSKKMQSDARKAMADPRGTGWAPSEESDAFRLGLWTLDWRGWGNAVKENLSAVAEALAWDAVGLGELRTPKSAEEISEALPKKEAGKGWAHAVADALGGHRPGFFVSEKSAKLCPFDEFEGEFDEFRKAKSKAGPPLFKRWPLFRRLEIPGAKKDLIVGLVHFPTSMNRGEHAKTITAGREEALQVLAQMVIWIRMHHGDAALAMMGTFWEPLDSAAMSQFVKKTGLQALTDDEKGQRLEVFRNYTQDVDHLLVADGVEIEPPGQPSVFALPAKLRKFVVDEQDHTPLTALLKLSS